MTRVTANGYFDAEDSKQVRFEKRKALNTQRTEDYKNGAYALAGGVVDPLSEDAPQFVKDYYAYYKTPRGCHPRSLNFNNGYSAQRINYIHIDANWLPFNFLRANRLSLIDTDVGGVRAVRRHLPEGAFDDGRGIIANAQFQKEDFLPRAGSEKTLIPRRCPMPALVLNKGIIEAEVHGHGLAAVGTGWKKLGRDFHIFLPLDHFTNRVCVFVRS